MDRLNLAQEIKDLNKNIIRLTNRQSFARSFFNGILSGLGSVIGATIVVAVLAFMLSNVQLIPVIGEWISQITEYVSNTGAQRQ